MKKIILSLVSLSFVYSHDFWLDGYNSSTFKAHIGYGHDFPSPEKIAKDRLSLFKPLVILNKNLEKITLSNFGENYQFQSKKPLEDGSYILKGEYKATYWTKTKDNKWYMGKTKNDIKNAEFCELASMFAKSIINIGYDDENFVTKPIGQKFEIIPLENPINFKVGTPFKVQVLLDKKPAKAVKIQGTFASFAKHQFAFYGTTDLKGEISITPLRGGKWILIAQSVRPFADKSCDDEFNAATLTFEIQ